MNSIFLLENSNGQFEFNTYHSPNTTISDEDSLFKLKIEKNANEILANFKYFLQTWAIKKYGNRKSAAKALNVSEKTLNDWKNKKSLETLSQ